MNFLVSTYLTLSDRGWPGYSLPESEASGARGGRCSRPPAGQGRALECTVRLRQRGPECWEPAEEKVDRWLYSAVRQVLKVYLYIKKVISKAEKKFCTSYFYIFIHTDQLVAVFKGKKPHSINKKSLMELSTGS